MLTRATRHSAGTGLALFWDRDFTYWVLPVRASRPTWGTGGCGAGGAEDLTGLISELRAAGGDTAAVEVKSAAGGLPSSITSTGKGGSESDSLRSIAETAIALLPRPSL